MLSLKIIYKLDFHLIIAKISSMGKDLNLRLIIRGSQDHALVGPQPKGSTQRVYAVKSVDPFCLGQVPAKSWPGFVFLKGKQM